MNRAVALIVAGGIAACVSGCVTSGSGQRSHWVMPVSLNLWKSSSTTIVQIDASSNTLSNGMSQSVEGGGSLKAQGIPGSK